MSFLRTTTLLLFTLLTFCLTAKEYTITTGRDAITGTLTTISRKKMITTLQEIGILPLTPKKDVIVPLNQMEIYNLTTSENYMLLDVVIKNNSPKAISLEKDAYLENHEAFIAPMEHITSRYWALWKDEDPYFALFFATTMLGVFSALGTGISIIDLMITHMKLDIVLALIFSSSAALWTTGSILSMKRIIALQAKRLMARQTARLSNGTKTWRYNTEAKTYTIPAGHTFHEKLVVDLQKVRRNFLESFSPSLIFSKKVTA